MILTGQTEYPTHVEKATRPLSIEIYPIGVMGIIYSLALVQWPSLFRTLSGFAQLSDLNNRNFPTTIAESNENEL